MDSSELHFAKASSQIKLMPAGIVICFNPVQHLKEPAEIRLRFFGRLSSDAAKHLKKECSPIFFKLSGKMIFCNDMQPAKAFASMFRRFVPNSTECKEVHL